MSGAVLCRDESENKADVVVRSNGTTQQKHHHHENEKYL